MKRLLIVGVLAIPTQASADAADDLVARGAYLATVMDCAGCHMPRGSDGAPLFESGLSGGTVGFEIPGLGVVWAPNLTPSDTGLGNWTDDDVAAAITQGLRPDGRGLAPAMPWPAYAALTEDDVVALIAFLRSLPPADALRIDPLADPAAAVAPFFRVVVP